MDKRDFLSLWDFNEVELRQLICSAATLKRERREGVRRAPLAGKTLGMIFEKASTRTRVSFEVGMFELGGHAVYLSPQGSQIGRGEPLRDTARVLGGYCHGIVVRTFGHDLAEELARFASVPVINGLTDLSHPCQVLADLLTAVEIFGEAALSADQIRYAWIGDGNNIAHSYIEAAAILGLDLVLACPEGYDPEPSVLARATQNHHPRTRIQVVREPIEAARDRQVLATDVWASMGEEAEMAERAHAFQAYRLDVRLLEKAAPNAIVLHCLPAHRGEEITDEVLEGPQSAVFQQAENRLHVQKAVLERLLA
jgi:ornithine carbamoyltransferase